MPGMGGMGWGMGCRWSPVPGVLTLGVCGLGLDLEPGPGPGVFGGAAEGFALGIFGDHNRADSRGVDRVRCGRV